MNMKLFHSYFPWLFHYEAHVDEKNRIVTCPAFMCETHFHEVFDGIGEMVKNVLKLAS